LPVDEAFEPVEDDDALDDGELPADVADPQAVASRAITPNATPFLIIPRTDTSSSWAARAPPGGRPGQNPPGLCEG
jgi:hypothetical protein